MTFCFATCFFGEEMGGGALEFRFGVGLARESSGGRKRSKVPPFPL